MVSDQLLLKTLPPPCLAGRLELKGDLGRVLVPRNHSSFLSSFGHFGGRVGFNWNPFSFLHVSNMGLAWARQRKRKHNGNGVLNHHHPFLAGGGIFASLTFERSGKIG